MQTASGSSVPGVQSHFRCESVRETLSFCSGLVSKLGIFCSDETPLILGICIFQGTSALPLVPLLTKFSSMLSQSSNIRLFIHSLIPCTDVYRTPARCAT